MSISAIKKNENKIDATMYNIISREFCWGFKKVDLI